MSGFSDITEINLPIECVEAVYKHLRAVGKEGVEGVALWAGQQFEEKFQITATLIPKQTAYKTEFGLMYVVDGDELHQINVWLYQNKLNLIAQIHSHPSEAYHSEMDDEYPIITSVGGISIVVPDFANRDFSLDQWAVYRLEAPGQWIELPYIQVKNLINIK